MMDLTNIFSGIFTGTGLTLGGFAISLGVALAMGALVALVCSHRTAHSKGFLMTIAILPAIVAVIIMMVNGSIGAGVAVAGAFSLIRFRSVPGAAREIGSIFLAMATGLACGMGYPLFGLLFTVILCIILVIYNKINIGERHNDLGRTLSITLPEDLNYTNIFNDLFEKYTTGHRLVKVKTTNLGSLNKLKYDLTLRNAGTEKDFIDELRCRNGNLEIWMSEIVENTAEL